MENNMQPLQKFIDYLEKGRNLHISILDFSGILTTPLTKIKFDHVIHSKKFCEIAKSTPRGYKTCLLCKSLANSKAVTQKTAFCGQCLYGLYESAFPVVIDDVITAIVYVGNAVIDEETTIKRIKKVCKYTKVPENELLLQLNSCEKVYSTNELLEVGEIVADYLKALAKFTPISTHEKHWIVHLMKQYAKENLYGIPSLSEFAVTHQKNAQYIGRLFKNEVGISFNQYCNNVRLEKAASILSRSNEKIINIAIDCGFQNVSYFNRLFQEKFGVSPSEYRKLQ